MDSLKVASVIITLFIILPISTYASWLLYNHIHATELMWFLWWTLTPISILITVLLKVFEGEGKE